MLHLCQFIATACAALFAGASLYINVAEHPGRMKLNTAAAAAQWAPSYQRATLMQAPLAVVSCLGGIGAWLLGGGAGWGIAALLIGAVVPFTLIIIMPTNRALLAPGRDLASTSTRELLVRWGRLHSVRTVLSLAAAALDLSLLV
jgi:hypothetical protein